MTDRLTLADSLAIIRSGWGATDEPPRPQGGGSRGAPGSRLPGANVDLRADIIRALAFWARALLDDRPHLLGPDEHLDLGDPLEVTRFLQVELADVMAWHADDGRPYHPTMLDDLRPLAQRVQALTAETGMYLGPCPRCHAGRVRSRRDEQGRYLEGRCDGCHLEAVIRWWAEEMGEAARLCTRTELPAILREHMGIEATPGLIRQWARRGIIPAAGRDTRGHRVYDTWAVYAALAARGRQRVATG